MSKIGEKVVEYMKMALLSYLFICVGMFLLQRSMIYKPFSRVLTLAETSIASLAQEITLQTEDGLALKSWYIPPKDDKPVILFTQGNGGTMNSRDYKAEYWAKAGYGVLMAEYRGYGGNPGNPSEQGVLLDALAGADWLKKEGIAPGKIVLYGESIGAAVVVQLAERLQQEGRKPAAMVLEAPFTSLANVAQEIYWYIPVKLLLLDRFDTLSRIGALELPMLILHGEMDGLTAVHHSRDLLKEVKGDEIMDGMKDKDAKLTAAAKAGETVGLIYPSGHHMDIFDHGAKDDVLTWLGAL